MMTAFLNSEPRLLVPAVDAPLQHTCDEMCAWVRHEKHSELFICHASQAVHECTLKLCQFRSDAGPKARGSHHHVDEGNSVCMLTGFIREPVEFARPEFGTIDGESTEMKKIHNKPKSAASALHLAYEEQHEIAQKILKVLFANALHTPPEGLFRDIATICVRLWRLVRTKNNRMLDKTAVCKFPDLCLIILADMKMNGVRVTKQAGDSKSAIVVVPPHKHVREWLPPTSALCKYTDPTTNQPFTWQINNSKCLHTAIASLDRSEQQLLANEIRLLGSFRL